MQLRKNLRLIKPDTDYNKNLDRELTSGWMELADTLNGGLKFSDNFNQETITVSDTGTADVEIAVTHTLKRIPVGFILINRNKAASVYSSGTAWTATTIYLKANLANCNITIMVF